MPLDTMYWEECDIISARNALPESNHEETQDKPKLGHYKTVLDWNNQLQHCP